MISRTFSARFDYFFQTMGDALRSAQRLPMAFILRAFGAGHIARQGARVDQIPICANTRQSRSGSLIGHDCEKVLAIVSRERLGGTILCREVSVLIRVKLIVAAILFFVPAIALSQDTRPAQLSLKDIQGRYIRLSDYRGKVVLINFWATWCPPCRAEIPDLIKLQRDYRIRGLQVIGVTYPPQKLAEVRRFVRSMKMNYPVSLGTKQTKLLFTPTDSLPTTIVVGADGRVRAIIDGILLPEEFEQKIKPLLK